MSRRSFDAFPATKLLPGGPFVARLFGNFSHDSKNDSAAMQHGFPRLKSASPPSAGAAMPTWFFFNRPRACRMKAQLHPTSGSCFIGDRTRFYAHLLPDTQPDTKPRY
jgi:hypothetical protein